MKSLAFPLGIYFFAPMLCGYTVLRSKQSENTDKRGDLEVTYGKRLTVLALLDSIIVLTAVYISYFTLNPELEIFKIPMLLVTALTLLISHHVFASIYKLYNKAWEYASV